MVRRGYSRWIYYLFRKYGRVVAADASPYPDPYLGIVYRWYYNMPMDLAAVYY